MKSSRPCRRSGAVLIVALVAIGIFSALAAANIRTLLRHRQSVKSERDLVQVHLLCDAGCDRAISMFTVDPNYTGELWLDQQDPNSGHHMKVVIRMSFKEGEPVAIIQASLEGRSYSPQRIQRTRAIMLRASK
ncbi:MAG: hypothetical protein ACK6DC_01990 [Planctomycetota bacterium]|jgi:type II secretory pathway pseudopilin PulG